MIPEEVRKEHMAICKKCEERKAIAKMVDFHVDWLDCFWDCPNDYEHWIKEKEMIFMSDPVNHPSHYETGKFESIDVMVETQGVEAVQDFCVCNAFKYIYRHKFKNGVEDLKKAIWYLNKYVELEDAKTD